MQLTVSGKHIDMSDALRDHVEAQLKDITKKFYDGSLDANVTFGKDRGFFTCGINLHAAQGVSARGEGSAADARAAFAAAATKLTAALRRQHDKGAKHDRVKPVEE